MSSIPASLAKKFVSNKAASHLAQYEPQDPYQTTEVNAKGKTKRVKRPLPPGLSPKDAKILHKVRKRAHYLDKGMSLCGFRVGWTFWLGLIPFLGDIIDALLNYTLVYKKSLQADIPDSLARQMLLNNIVSASVGAIPVAGDIILGMYKANSRNAHLLEAFLEERGRTHPYNATSKTKPSKETTKPFVAPASSGPVVGSSSTNAATTQQKAQAPALPPR